MKIIKILKPVLSVVIIVALLAGAQKLVQPKYASGVVEGNFTSEYYEETTKHDVLFVGDCEVYENVDPIYLWSHYGITSYIRGNAQQLAWQSYYMLEDTLKRETPKVVIYNVQALTHAQPQKEEYNRMTLDGMRWSKTKWNAIRASMCEGEKMIDYVFPLLRYHSRITELTGEDFTYFNKHKKTLHNGYYMRVDVLPVSESDVADVTWILGDKESEEQTEEEDIIDPWAEIEGAEEEEEVDNSLTDTKEGEPFGSLPMEYLDRIRTLCEQKGIQLILMKAPSAAPVWYDSDNQQILDYADKNHLPYINFYDLLEETGIDYETDTYDGGLHMNLSGAEKISEYLGRTLSESYKMVDHRGESEYDKVYEEKVAFHDDMKRKQEEELKKYGEIRNY